MRVDGFSSHSYPIKRKPQKRLVRLDDDTVIEGVEGDLQVEQPAARQSAAGASRGGAVSRMPVRARNEDDENFADSRRPMSSRVAEALSSYLTTATFVEWDGEVLGLDVRI
ncbi:hypothetical protein [Pseudomonas sp. KNUC1026]|uniref:hypothetical protein n=1 Tax=Pseudomonas sp. KNUC1026 TaxID=2893890 RepID=UPI001F26B010|nr:hypothetical protein [Pseudomonas sp. KNUC1026]UFH48580.1 hypothetical protein LN139_16010 [Pseudomonas sp. KNUC1026]